MFERSRKARSRSHKTVGGYVESARLLAAFLADHGMPQAVGAIHRAHVEVFIADQLDRWTPSTAATRYRHLVLLTNGASAFAGGLLNRAGELLRRVQESEQRWDALTRLVNQRRAPERSVGAVFDAALGFRVRYATYRGAGESSEGTQSRRSPPAATSRPSSKRASPIGEKRGRVYVATDDVRREQAGRHPIRARRFPRPPDDLTLWSPTAAGRPVRLCVDGHCRFYGTPA